MMGFPNDSFELLKSLVDEPDNASFESALNNEDISSFSKNTEKKLQISSIIFPSKTEKEITHQEKTPGIKKEVVSFNSFSQL
jgi:hypothetical protein